MKKKLMGLIVCLIGFGMGFLSLLYSNETVRSLEEYRNCAIDRCCNNSNCAGGYSFFC